jgi:uncharacterized protein (DUF2062 family)
VFMGIVPIWGFQLVTAIAISIVLRLNKALVIIAANISIPPFIPFILYGSMVSGSFWMGARAVSLPAAKDVTMEFIQTSLTQYLFGSITLAVVAGTVSGLVTYTFLWLKGSKNSNMQKQ